MVLSAELAPSRTTVLVGLIAGWRCLSSIQATSTVGFDDSWNSFRREYTKKLLLA